MISYINNSIELKKIVSKADEQFKKLGKSFLTKEDYLFFKKQILVLENKKQK